MTLISKSEWARRHGFSKSYVSKLIKQGKLSLYNGMIDEDKANARADLKKQLLEAKLNNEIYKGQILEAQANKIAAQYVSTEAVRKVVSARNKVIRDTILKIPDRVSSAIAALKDASEIHFLLTNEIRNTLFELSNDTTV
ncbi:MAG: hypothetical protein LBB21_00235 [Holosporaceae bacterium]|nr:hypothetical protein [Holosporaceae bacterium]